MKPLSQILFWIGIISIPLSWMMWHFGPEIELGKQVFKNIEDPILRSVLMESHAEHWGIFIATWPVTLLVLSYIIEKKAK
jgi:hypothetical protein